MLLLRLDRLLALGHHAHVLGARPESAHDDVAVRGVRAEQVVRVRVVATDDELDLILDGHGHAPSSSSRTIPATGTGTQSGRWASS